MVQRSNRALADHRGELIPTGRDGADAVGVPRKAKLSPPSTVCGDCGAGQ